MNVLIPMAGSGQRFVNQGYTRIKPLIDVDGEYMITRVLDNLDALDGQYIFVVRDEHAGELTPVLKGLRSDCHILSVSKPTEGQASTCLIARELIDFPEALIVTNCDQIMEWDAREFAQELRFGNVDGLIATYYSTHPNNSYVIVNRHGYVTVAVEKQVISEFATTGLYGWRCGRDMVRACEQMIASNDRCNGEFYVCPSYNYLVAEGLVVKTQPVRKHYPIGTPEDLAAYCESRASKLVPHAQRGKARLRLA